MTRFDPALTIEPGDPSDERVTRLLRASEELSRELYPPESIHTLPAHQLSSPSVHFIVARCQRTRAVLGCGALVVQPDSCGELKRMFVAPESRRQGVGAALLRALEHAAQSAGIRTVRLETGIGQPEAVSLYRSFGYFERGPFGSYRPDPLSIFMEKRLS